MSRKVKHVWVIEYLFCVQDLPKARGKFHEEWLPAPFGKIYLSQTDARDDFKEARRKFKDVILAKYVHESEPGRSTGDHKEG